MKRIAEEKLEAWHRSDGHKPLVIRGARQVGKSTLVRMFAEKTKLNLYEINLERHLELDEVFKSLDVNRIIRELNRSSELRLTPPMACFFWMKSSRLPMLLRLCAIFTRTCLSCG